MSHFPYREEVLARKFLPGENARARKDGKWVKVRVVNKVGDKVRVRFNDGVTRTYAHSSLRGVMVGDREVHALRPMSNTELKTQQKKHAKGWRKPIIDQWTKHTGGSLYFRIDKSLHQKSKQELLEGLQKVGKIASLNPAMRHVLRKLRIAVRKPNAFDKKFNTDKCLAFADFRSRSIVFNANHWANDSLEGTLDSAKNQGFLVHPSRGGILVHEIGHLLEYYARRGNATNRKYPKLVLLANKMHALYNEAKLGNIPAISKYALTNSREFYAEAFCAAMYNVKTDNPAVKIMQSFFKGTKH